MRNKKIEKTHAKESNYTHKTIFTWFDNLPTSTELQEFHYYLGKIKSAATMFFFFFFLVSQETRQQQNPNLKIGFSRSCAYDSQWATKWAKNFPRGKPPLHGLNLKKSPIKNHTILFGSGRVVKSDQMKLGSTKPNKREYTKFSYLKQIH